MEEVKEELVKNGHFYKAKPELDKVLAEKFDVDVSIKLVGLAKIIGSHYQTINNLRTELLKLYGDRDDKGGIRIIPPNNADGLPPSKNWEEFQMELNNLLNADIPQEVAQSLRLLGKIRLPRFVSIKCESCGKVIKKKLEIEPLVLLALEPFMEIEKEKEDPKKVIPNKVIL